MCGEHGIFAQINLKISNGNNSGIVESALFLKWTLGSYVSYSSKKQLTSKRAVLICTNFSSNIPPPPTTPALPHPVHAHVHACTHTCARTHTQLHAHTHTHACVRACVHAHTHTHTHMCMHAHPHTHKKKTHTHTHRFTGGRLQA